MKNGTLSFGLASTFCCWHRRKKVVHRGFLALETVCLVARKNEINEWSYLEQRVIIRTVPSRCVTGAAQVEILI